MATANVPVCGEETEDVFLVPADDEYTSEVESCDSYCGSFSESGIFSSSPVLRYSPAESIFTIDSRTKRAARSTMKNLEDKDESISILFVGKQGVGKSSLINGLIGREVATEGADPYSVTKFLEKPYEREHVKTRGRRIQVTVWDTHGLDGSRKDKENIRHLQEIFPDIDLLVYCISVVGGRLDERTLRKFATTNQEIWQYAVIALTYANNITETATCKTEEETKQHFEKIVKFWASAIGTCLQKSGIPLDVIDTIPVVPTGYHRKTISITNPLSLPTCSNWLKIFWYQCLNRCKKSARHALVQQNKERFKSCVSTDEDLPIDEQPISLILGEEEHCYNATGNEISIKEMIMKWIAKIIEFLKKDIE